MFRSISSLPPTPARTRSDNILDVARGEKIYLSGGAGYEDLTKYTGGSMYQAEADTQLAPFLEGLAQGIKNPVRAGLPVHQ